MAKRTVKTATRAGRTAKAGQLVVSTNRRAGDAVAAARSEPARARQTVPATQAKNRFGEILQTARDSGPVFIERHGRAQAVVLGIEAYHKLTSNERSPQERELDYWTREFEVLHARMQSPRARQAVDDLFSATDAELNRRDA